MHAHLSIANLTSLVQSLVFTLATAMTMSSCIDGPKPFAQKGNGAKSYVPVTSDGANVSGSFSATSSATQILQIDQISALNGTSLAIPAGALGRDTTISVTQGSSIVHSSSLSSLNVSGSSGGPAVVIRSSSATNTLSAMSLQIPVSSSASLMLADSRDYDKMVVMFKADDSDTSDRKLGIIPRSELKLIDNKIVEFSTTRFGSYQVAFLSTTITKLIEIKTTEEIVAKAEEVLKSFTLVSSSKAYRVGDVVAISAIGEYNDGSKREIGPDLLWASANPQIMEYKSSNEFRAIAAGKVELRAATKDKRVERLVVAVLPKLSSSPLPTPLAPPNTPPTLTIGANSGLTLVSGAGTSAGARKIFTVLENANASLQFVGADIEGDPLSYQCTGARFATLDITSGLLSINPLDSDSGTSITLDCRVNTPVNGQFSAYWFLQIDVTPVNDAPLLGLAPIGSRVDATIVGGTGISGDPFVFNIPVANYRASKVGLAISDIDSGTFNVICTQKPGWTTVAGSNPNFELQFSPVGLDFTAANPVIICKVNDSQVDSALLYIKINLIEPPTLAFLQQVNNGNLGGLDGADAACRNGAVGSRYAGLNFKALLTGNYLTLYDRLQSNGPVYAAYEFGMGSKLKIADTLDDFIDNTWQAPLQSGLFTPSIAAPIFTGLAYNSVASNFSKQASGVNCRNWRSTAGNAVIGDSAMPMSSSTQLCSSPAAIICVSQAGAPSLKTFAVAPGAAGTVDVTYEFDTGVSPRTQALDIRYNLGGNPPSTCAAGALGATVTLINTGVHNQTINSLSPGSNYSFLACLRDNNNVLVPANVARNIPARPSALAVFATNGNYPVSSGTAAFDSACITEAGGSSVTQIQSSAAGFQAVVSTSTLSAIDKIIVDLPVFHANLSAAIVPTVTADQFWNIGSTAIKDRLGMSLGSYNFWTGTLAGGLTATGSTCADWTSASSGIFGAIGSTGFVSNNFNTGTSACNNSQRLLCIGRVPLP